LAIFAPLTVQGTAIAQDKVTISVLLLNDEGKPQNGMDIHIVPRGEVDVPFGTTKGNEGCNFTMPSCDSFDVVAWNGNEYVGRVSSFSGRKDQKIPINVESLRKKADAKEKLLGTRTYVHLLSIKPKVSKDIIVKLQSESFTNQVQKLLDENKLPEADKTKIRDQIFSDIKEIGRPR